MKDEEIEKQAEIECKKLLQSEKGYNGISFQEFWEEGAKWGLAEDRKESKEYIRYLKRQRQGGIQKQYNKISKIKELEEENERLKAEKQQMQEQVKKIILDENAEIGDLRKIVGMDWYDVKEIEQLKADLEEARKHCKAVDEVNVKLRCCGNCKHKVECDTQLLDAFMKNAKPKIICKNKSKWEMKE